MLFHHNVWKVLELRCNTCLLSACSVSCRTLLHWQTRLWGHYTNAAQLDNKFLKKHHSFKFQTKENVLQK